MTFFCFYSNYCFILSRYFLIISMQSSGFINNTILVFMAMWNHSDPSRTRLWNASAATIFGGLPPEKIARCQVKYLKKGPYGPFFNDKLFLAIRTPVCAPSTDFFSQYLFSTFFTIFTTSSVYQGLSSIISIAPL